jgi:hypothetical protein
MDREMDAWRIATTKLPHRALRGIFVLEPGQFETSQAWIAFQHR